MEPTLGYLTIGILFVLGVIYLCEKYGDWDE